MERNTLFINASLDTHNSYIIKTYSTSLSRTVSSGDISRQGRTANANPTASKIRDKRRPTMLEQFVSDCIFLSTTAMVNSKAERQRRSERDGSEG
ncbi:hypothetical protein ACOSQ4_005317 [Xanthoceras sorbifolium]